jgi:uncharacterized protein (DUF169 family)
MLSNEERSAAIENLLRLSRIPLAIKFVTTSEPLSDIPKASFTPPSSCAFWTQGVNQPLLTEPEQHMNCSVGAYVHGFKTLEEIGPGCGCEDVDFLLKIGRFDRQDLANIPRLHLKPAQIIYSPLTKMGDEPDVVLLFTIPSQAQLLFEAAGRAGIPTAFRGMPTCTIIPTAIQTQGVVFGLGCAVSRLRAGYGNEEILVALTPKTLDKLLEVLDELAQSEEKMIRYELKKLSQPCSDGGEC